MGFFISIFAPNAHAISWEEWVGKVEAAIQSSMDYEVVLEDVLGEAQDGVSAWDNDPRVVGSGKGNRVNCMIWLQMVIAKIYANSSLSVEKALDHVRYFGGMPAFCLRKHYTDHWVLLDSAPLVPVDLQDCTKLKRHQVKLKPDVFLKNRGYSCKIYGAEKTDIAFQFATPIGLKSCTKQLPPGYYVFFAVPTKKYNDKYLKDSGPMGLVHAMFLNIPVGAKEQVSVYHASTSAKKVLHESLDKFLENSKNIHQGYSVYELDPDWNPNLHPLILNPSIQALLDCEKNLPHN